MDNPSLREVQRWMRARIRAAQPEHGAPAGLLNPQGGVPGVERMSVYAEGYPARIHEALAEAYEAVRFVMGERAFSDLSRAYAAQLASSDYSLSGVGRRLPEFLIRYPVTARLPVLPDLARLEWSVAEAFGAESLPSPDARRLTAAMAQDAERARFVFQPAVSVVVSDWPILDIWASRKRPRETVDIAVEGRPQAVLVYREGLDVRCEGLERPQALVLAGLIQGQPLGEALGAAASLTGPDADVAAWFFRWVRLGLIADVPTGASNG